MDPQDPGKNALSEAEVVVFGRYRFDRRALLLSRDGDVLPVQPKPLAVLRCLVDRPGEVLLKDELLDTVWRDSAVTENSLAEAVRMLRQALGDDPKAPTYVETVHRRGYRFIAPVTVAGESRASADAEERAGLEAGAPPPRAARLAQPYLVLAAALALGAVAIIWASGLLRGDVSPPLGIAKVNLGLPDAAPAWVVSGRVALAISADGRRVLYASLSRDLYVRDIDSETPRMVEDSTYAELAAFSPDGREVAFFLVRAADPRSRFTGYRAEGWAEAALMRADTESGRPIEVVAVPGYPLGLAWGHDGTLFFSTSERPGLWVLPREPGATPTLIAESAGLFFRDPQLLPDGKTVIAESRACYVGLHTQCFVETSDPRIVALSLESQELTELLDRGGRPRLVANEYLVVGSGQELLAAPFDVRSGRVTGATQRVFTGLMSTGRGFDETYFDVSPGGALVFVSSNSVTPPGQTYLVNRDGSREALGLWLEKPSISPDGTRIAGVPLEGAHGEIVVYERGRDSTPTTLTSGADAYAPIWTPEGNRIAFADQRNGNYDLYSMPVVSGAEPTLLVDSDNNLAPESWSPDGRLLLYTESDPVTGDDIWILQPGQEPIPFLRTPAMESGAAFSPDGRWIVYHSDDSGIWEIYLARVPEDLANHDATITGVRYKVSSDCGGFPAWSPDGSELYFRHCGRGPDPDQFFAVSIDTTGAEPDFGVPTLLFEGYYSRTRRGPSYGVTLDGKFLVPAGDDTTTQLGLWMNWDEELRELVPGGQ